ncbi:apolipoprotein L4-like [Parasteatoda tepidariorum]|uniref:apolipoprotein L4-like n=1 Tax=Parasteatoda tepidariorum TaxID=114398 RepID=UPI00077FD1E2|nr:uncharacterized protein LOC107438399 [Parasteatoda tepidariorum]
MTEANMSHLALFNSVFNTSTIESLRAEEKLIASLIFENAREVVMSMANGDLSSEESSDEDENDVEFTNKFELTRRNLRMIIDAFNEAQKARQSFQKYCPKWAPSRKKNISRLREIADCINTDRFNCNVATITGSSVGIAGGVAIGVSLVFPPAAIVLGAVGGIASLAGGATVFGTAVTQTTLLRKKMSKAQEILTKDGKQFLPLAKWFQHSQNLIDLLDKIIGFDIMQEIFEGLKNFKADVTHFLSLKTGVMHSLLKKLIKLFVEKAAPSGFGACSEFEQIIPVVIAFVFVVIFFRKNNSLLFNCIVLTHRTVLGLLKLFDMGSDLGMLIYNAAAKAGLASTELITKATAKMVTQGVLVGIGVALDVANLVVASIDVHKGSVSEQAVQLKAAANQLENELKIIKAVYNALF